MQELLKIFRALSDETRLRILKLLQKKELCVCEIMQALEISQTRASRNLGILKNAGLVCDRREGLWVHYSLNRQKKNTYQQAINTLINKWLNNEETIVKDAKRLKKAVKLSKKEPVC